MLQLCTEVELLLAGGWGGAAGGLLGMVVPAGVRGWCVGGLGGGQQGRQWRRQLRWQWHWRQRRQQCVAAASAAATAATAGGGARAGMAGGRGWGQHWGCAFYRSCLGAAVRNERPWPAPQAPYLTPARGEVTGPRPELLTLGLACNTPRRRPWNATTAQVKMPIHLHRGKAEHP